MSRKRWIGLILGLTVFLVAFGVALAATFFQVTRDVDSVLRFNAVEVRYSGDLGLFFDEDLTKPAEFLVFGVLDLQPPLGAARDTGRRTLFLVNNSPDELFLIEPCREVISNGVRVGHMSGDIFDLGGNRLGHICDRPSPRIPPFGVVRGEFAIFDLDPNLTPGEHPFVALFAGVGRIPEVPPAGSDFSAWTDSAPVRDGEMSPGEWDMADCRQNEIIAKPLTICAMNDATQLYIAVIVPDQAYPDTNVDFLKLLFDNDNDGTIVTGDDHWSLRYDNTIVNDLFNPTGIPHHTSLNVDDGGTNDLDTSATHSNPIANGVGNYVAEYAHHMDTSDDAHDISLAVGDVVGFAFRMSGTPDFYWPNTVPSVGWATYTVAAAPGP